VADGNEPRWFEHLGPVTVKLECGGRRHAITWRRGKLVLEDHPGLQAERALAVLGGQAVTCLDVLDAWVAATSSHQMAPSLLGAAGPPPDAFLRAVGRHRDMSAKVIGTIPDRHRRDVKASQMVQQRRLAATNLPGELRSRLALALVVHCERRWDELPQGTRISLRMVLGDKIKAALTTSVHHWTGLPLRRGVRVDTVIVGAGAAVGIAGRVGPGGCDLTVRLPLSWLVRVADRDLAVVDGAVVLAVDDPDVLAVRWEPMDGGAWQPAVGHGRLLAEPAAGRRLQWAPPAGGGPAE
jgi:hypothetical protein